MSVPSLADVQKQIESLRAKPLQDHQRLLRALGNYFRVTIPSELDDGYILQVEVLLNDMSLRAESEGWSSDLQNSLLEALGMVAYLSDNIKRRPGKPRSTTFFKTAKRLGKVLVRISRLG